MNNLEAYTIYELQQEINRRKLEEEKNNTPVSFTKKQFIDALAKAKEDASINTAWGGGSPISYDSISVYLMKNLGFKL